MEAVERRDWDEQDQEGAGGDEPLFRGHQGICKPPRMWSLCSLGLVSKGASGFSNRTGALHLSTEL